MAKIKCTWGECENDAEYREMANGKIWMELCQNHHNQLGEIPVDYVKIENNE